MHSLLTASAWYVSGGTTREKYWKRGFWLNSVLVDAYDIWGICLIEEQKKNILINYIRNKEKISFLNVITGNIWKNHF